VSPLLANQSPRIFRAPWVIPVTSAVLSDGAVVLDQDSIIAVGQYDDIVARFSDLPVTKCSGVILPALVNAHIHLDLSIYGPVPQESAESSMCDWISSLLKKRMDSNYSIQEIRDAAEKIAVKQHESGVGLMLDTGNTDLGKFQSCSAEIISLFEMLGPSKLATEAAIKTITELPCHRMVTGHAPYSTTPELLKFIKKRSIEKDSIFSFHLLENLDESLLLIKGSGCFSKFLKERGATSDTFPIPGIDTKGVVGYLQKTGILDRNTLCVHCVHLSDQEIKLIAESDAYICLCPTSNSFLNVGRAPLERILNHGLLPALGTDSITSNPMLDMWDEMALVKQNHPTVSVDTILSMATHGGAMALHREKRFGSLECGRTSSILNICATHYEKATNAWQLVERITSGGRPDSINWLSPVNTISN